MGLLSLLDVDAVLKVYIINATRYIPSGTLYRLCILSLRTFLLIKETPLPKVNNAWSYLIPTSQPVCVCHMSTAYYDRLSCFALPRFFSTASHEKFYEETPAGMYLGVLLAQPNYIMRYNINVEYISQKYNFHIQSYRLPYTQQDCGNNSSANICDPEIPLPITCVTRQLPRLD